MGNESFWPEVSRFYDRCKDDDERLKQRIRRAFEKANLELPEYEDLAWLLFDKIKPSINGMKTPS